METIEYDEELIDAIKELHAGMEDRPQYPDYVADHMAGPGSRVAEYVDQMLPEIEHRCGPLSGKRVLDFGCGTGATTVALCQGSKTVSVFDIDPLSVKINQLRIRAHKLEDHIEEVFCAPSLDELLPQMGDFDFILMNGVLEHIPMSIPGLREQVLRQVFSLLRPGARLFISDTPNRVIPFDDHSTQLWGIPWTRPGSPRAYARAIAKGRHSEVGRYSPGPLGLEQEGAWGATYWEIKRYLKGEDYRVMNLEPEFRRRLHYAIPSSSKRGLIEAAFAPIVALTRAPLTAFMPYLTNLVIERRS